MNSEIKRGQRRFSAPFLPRNVNSIMEFGRRPSCVYVLLQDSEADSGDVQENKWLLSNAAVQIAAGMGAEVRRSAWPFLTTEAVDDVVRHTSLRLFSTWAVGVEEKEGNRAGLENDFLPKGRMCTDVHLAWNETSVIDAYGGAGSLGVIEQYVQSSSDFVEDRYWGRALHHITYSIYHDVLALLQSQWGAVERPVPDKAISVDVEEINPARMADVIVHTYKYDERWLGRFADQLHKRLPSVSLTKVIRVWNLATHEAAAGFDVSCEMLEQWIKEGVPGDRMERLSEVAAATDVLLHYLKAERIPAVVRKPIKRLDGRSLLDLYSDGKSGQVLEQCRSMFRFENVHG